MKNIVMEDIITERLTVDVTPTEETAVHEQAESHRYSYKEQGTAEIPVDMIMVTTVIIVILIVTVIMTITEILT